MVRALVVIPVGGRREWRDCLFSLAGGIIILPGCFSFHADKEIYGKGVEVFLFAEKGLTLHKTQDNPYGRPIDSG